MPLRSLATGHRASRMILSPSTNLSRAKVSHSCQVYPAYVMSAESPYWQTKFNRREPISRPDSYRYRVVLASTSETELSKTSDRLRYTKVYHNLTSREIAINYNQERSDSLSRYQSNPRLVKRLLALTNHLVVGRQTALFVSSRRLQDTPMNLLPVKIATRFMTTTMKGSKGSGSPITEAQETLLTKSKCNRRIKINACGELYNQLSETKPSLYKNAPKKVGIDFEVSYYDSANETNDCGNQKPVVCLLHGAPGHYKDFASLISYLEAKDIRVVAPNFPNYTVTYEHSFRHSPLERLDYLLNFFGAIQLTKIDMLIGHSSAVYTMFELLNHIHSTRSTTKGLKVESLGLFNTPSYNLPPNMAVTPFRLFTLKLFDYPFMRPIIVALIQVFVKLQGIQNRVDSSRIENLLIAASAVGYSESEKMSDYLKMVRNFQIPTFLLVGNNDKLVPKRCYDQLKRDLGIVNDRPVRIYDYDGTLKKDVDESDNLVHVTQLEAGGHYAFQKYSNIVNRDVYSFLTDVLKKATKDSTKL